MHLRVMADERGARSAYQARPSLGPRRELAVWTMRVVWRVKRVRGRRTRLRCSDNTNALVHKQDLVRPGRKRMESRVTCVVVEMQMYEVKSPFELPTTDSMPASSTPWNSIAN